MEFVKCLKIFSSSYKNFATLCFCLRNKPRLNIIYFQTSLCNISIRNFTSIESKENTLIDMFTTYLNCKPKFSESFLESNKHFMNYNVNEIRIKIEMCLNFNISQNAICENLWLLETQTAVLNNKLDLLSKMNLVDINHGIPFLRINERALLKVYRNFKFNDENKSNKFYYLCEKLKVEPTVLAEALSERLFILNIPRKTLEEVVDTLIEYNVKTECILKDLWVFRYKPEIIKNRLKLFHASGRKPIMPWMVRCSNQVLERSINLTVVTKKVLGENDSTLWYLANRLNCSYETVCEMCAKIPSIKRARVSKIKNTLDFFFSVGYNEQDIIYVPRVLAHSLKTLKKRLEILNTCKIPVKNLNTICKTRKEFNKIISSLTKDKVMINNDLYLRTKNSLTPLSTTMCETPDKSIETNIGTTGEGSDTSIMSNANIK